MPAPTLLSEFVDTMFHILSIPTSYWNAYPYNLGYWHGDNFSFDCVCLLKSVLNGWYDNRTVGYYQADLSRTGDLSEWELITACRGMSNDFTLMDACACLYMGGHIGCYMGGEFNRGGNIYNSIECTTSFGGGVVASYVDENGDRWNNKSKTEYGGRWLYYGYLSTWLTYDSQFLDPGRDTDPINPGGGGVTPPGWESPVLKEKNKFKWWMYMKPYYRRF